MTVPIVGKMMPIMKRTVFKIICLKTFWVVLLTSIWSDSTSANLKGSCKKKSKSPLQTFNILLSDCFHTGRGPESTKGALGHCSRYSVLRLPVGRLKIGWDRKLSKCKQFVNVWPSEWHDMCFCRTREIFRLSHHNYLCFEEISFFFSSTSRSFSSRSLFKELYWVWNVSIINHQ